MSRAVTYVGVLAACVVFVALLLVAARIGQQHRCDWLTAHNSPAATTYDCTPTGAR